MNSCIALDPGEKRIGVAVSDPLGISVRPLPFIPAVPEDAALAAIAALVTERGAGTIVVGLPINMDGTEGPAAKKARDFAERVRSVLGASAPEIVMWDESLTSHEAEQKLFEKKLPLRERKQLIDSLAAAILLKAWLDARSDTSAPGARDAGE